MLVCDFYLYLVIVLGLELESTLARYIKDKAKKKAKVEATFQKIHNQNQDDATKEGLSLAERHEKMSAIGNSSNNRDKSTDTNTDTEVSYVTNSADYVLSYLFPRVRGKKKK